MKVIKPVKVTKGSLLFCRISTTIMLIVGLVLLEELLVLIVGILMVLSSILKVRNSPMVFIYMKTIDKIKPSKDEFVDEKAMAFAHMFGGIILLISFGFFYFDFVVVGIILAGFITLMKFIGIFGFCTATKLYNCVGNTSCCSIRDKNNA